MFKQAKAAQAKGAARYGSVENAHPLDEKAKEDARGMWDAAGNLERKKTLMTVGYSEYSGMATKRWTELPADVQQKLMSEVFGLENALDKKFTEAKESYKAELAQHEKTLEMAKKANDAKLISEAEALVKGAKDKLAQIGKQDILGNAGCDLCQGTGVSDSGTECQACALKKNAEIEPEHLAADKEDLQEIERHAEGVEHEVKEMLTEDEPLANKDKGDGTTVVKALLDNAGEKCMGCNQEIASGEETWLKTKLYPQGAYHCRACGDSAADTKSILSNSWTPEFLKRNPDYKSRIEPKLKAKWDGASDAQREKWAAATGSGGSASEGWDTIMSQGGSTAEVIMEQMAGLVGERINGIPEPKCPKCGSADTWGEENKQKLGELACHACGHKFMDYEAKMNAISKEQAVGILKWVAGEDLKPISVNMESGETVTIEELEKIAGTGPRPEHRNARTPFKRSELGNTRGAKAYGRREDKTEDGARKGDSRYGSRQNEIKGDARSDWQSESAYNRGLLLTSAGIDAEHEYLVRVGFDSLPSNVQSALKKLADRHIAE